MRFCYEALLLCNAEGFLLAGRCSSTTVLGYHGGGCVGNMISVEQLVGTAAALCAQDHQLSHDIGVRLVQG